MRSWHCLVNEIKIITTRASGPGGQHVNKTESKVELHWNVFESTCLSDLQKYWLRQNIGRRFSEEGLLILTSQKSRSQLQNREDVTTRFLDLISSNIQAPKKRIKTRPSRSSVEARLKAKKQHSEKKKRRGGKMDY